MNISIPVKPPLSIQKLDDKQLYEMAWKVRQDGMVGSVHILPDRQKKALCGTTSRSWRNHGLNELALERVYRMLERRIEPKHRPRKANSPCRRCMIAAQKLRDPLERLADIKVE